MSYFKHDYIETSDFFSDAKVFCMRCKTPLIEETYVQMKKRNSNEMVNVIAKKKYPNYNLVQYEFLEGKARGTFHLILCSDCKKASLSDEDKAMAVEQIKRANAIGMRWRGYSDKSINSTNALWDKRTIGRCLEGVKNGKH